MNILFFITSAVEQAVLKGFAQAIEKLGIESDDDDPLAALEAKAGVTAIESSEKPAKKGR